MVTFNSLEEAVRAVSTVKRKGLRPLMIELLDSSAIRLVREFTGLPLPEAEALLLVDLETTMDSSARHLKALVSSLRESGASEIRASDKPEEMERLYLARKAVYPACLKLRPKPNVLLEDLTVPPSKMPHVVKEIKALEHKYGIPIVIFGHVGDGNLHPVIFADANIEDEWKRAFSALS